MSTETTQATESPTKDVHPREPAPPRVVFQPRVDVYEGDSDWMILADLPGVQPADLKVSTEASELRIVAQGLALDGATPVEWRRGFQLPRGTAVEAIAAVLKDGVLSLTLPKAAELRSRSIEVRGG